MKRKVSLLLAFIMLFSILPATAFAAGADGQLMALNENAESTDIPQTPTLVSKTANSLTVEARPWLSKTVPLPARATESGKSVWKYRTDR